MKKQALSLFVVPVAPTKKRILLEKEKKTANETTR